MVKLLEPFEAITRRLSGGKYPTLNMVHPYMCTLKRMFAPRANENETVNSYLDLIYGPLIPKNEENVEDDASDSSSVSNDDDIPIAGNKHWKSWGRGRERGQGQEQGQGQGRDEVKVMDMDVDKIMVMIIFRKDQIVKLKIQIKFNIFLR